MIARRSRCPRQRQRRLEGGDVNFYTSRVCCPPQSFQTATLRKRRLQASYPTRRMKSGGVGRRGVGGPNKLPPSPSHISPLRSVRRARERPRKPQGERGGPRRQRSSASRAARHYRIRAGRGFGGRNVPQINGIHNNIKRIFDPVHDFIELDDAEVTLLATEPMQRLRRLRQLGLAYLAFPGAEHSRFSHALGALAIGERVIESLRRHDGGYFADERDFAHQRRLLRASLLLHDVGHGPFSHACEAVLGVRHELRTREILDLPAMRRAIAALDVDQADVIALIAGDGPTGYPVLKEIVSGPNLDADRMDYLLRDAYFTGVVSGRYDADQLIGSLRVIEREGRPALGVDGRGVVALESFVLARYMMFATIYFHHTTRMFERVLHEALGELWPHPAALGPIDEYLAWDDFRVLEALRTLGTDAARALRERHTLYGLAAEFNAERDLSTYELCLRALRERFPETVWADAQEQLLHRLPLGSAVGAPTVLVRTHLGIVDAREASDVIAKLSGKAAWRKIFVRKAAADIDEARRIAREVIAKARAIPVQFELFEGP